MTEPLARTEQVSRVFGTGSAAVHAVREVSVEITPRMRVALVGPSGSGKSTLLHLMAALDRPTSGSIEWPALGGPDALRPGPVSFAFQGPSLLPPLTVAENVALPLLLSGLSEREAMADAADLLERVELTEVADKLPEELSGGQAQRAGLARALIGTPRLVLADEPTGQLDRATGQRMIDVLLTSLAEDAALVVATHDPAVVGRMAERWDMRDGTLRMGVTLRSL